MCSRGKPMDSSPPGFTCRSSCVKLYLCSNPEDSVVERRALRERVSPKLREHCRHTHGLDFRVIDPFESSDPSRWPDENTRQQLIKECRENSAGPFLLALLGHRYGSARPPAQVDVSEYQLLLRESQRAGVSTRALERVYRRDENTVPPSYWRRPAQRPTCCPQAEVNEEEQRRTEAGEEEELRKVFQTTVSLCVHDDLMTPERGHRYYRSALDADLRFALSDRPDDDVARRCLIYVHKVVNAERERETEGRVNSQSEADVSDLRRSPTDGQLLSELCDNFLPALIASCRLLVYTTTTECDRRCGYTTARRRGYAELLCQQVHSDLVRQIDASRPLDAGNLKQLADAAAREQAEQEELCETMSRFYDVVRSEEVEIRAYVKKSDQHLPLVVLGGTCSGKTVLLAHCAQQIKSWLPDSDPVVISYFCSLQQALPSTHLLSSLCYQIASGYHNDAPRGTCPDITKPDVSLSELRQRLSSLLSLLPSPRKPLVLNVDGLDQIGNSAQIIESLPSPLPPAVKLILTVSSSQAHVLQAIKLHYPQCSEEEPGHVCVQLGPADRKECVRLLASLLRSSGRRVTSGQQAVVNWALTSCRLTLYARLLHEHTSLWNSDSDVVESSLPVDVHTSISLLLDHLEREHGSWIVARAVAYLALSRTGLTEAELADLLSGDDEVRRYESPPPSSSGVRVPQVDVERLLLDLRRFLVGRTAAGSRVLSWVSRHFTLAVAERYLGTQEARNEIHSKMADYFSGRWVCGNAKQLLDGPNKETAPVKLDINRQPSSQPFVFTCSSTNAGRVNLRKVAELPHHLRQIGRWEELERGVLMSYGFHQAMVRAGLLRDLVTMLEDDEPQLVFLRERLLLAASLKSSAWRLQSVPLQLPAAMETSLLPYLEVFPALERYVTEIRRERRTRGSGLRAVICPAPSSVSPIRRLKCDAATSVAEAAATECGIVAEVTDDGSAQIWKGPGCDLATVSLSRECRGLKFAGVKSSGRFLLLSTRCDRLFLWDVTGPDMFLEVKDPFDTKSEPESSKQTRNRIKGFVGCRENMFMWRKDESFASVFNVSGEALTRLRCGSSVTSLVRSSNGCHVFCGQEEGTVSVFDLASGCLLGSGTSSDHGAVTAIILCEDERECLACVHGTGTVTLWDVAAEAGPLRLVKERFSPGKSDNNTLGTDHSEETGTLLVCHADQVTLWDTCDWEVWDRFSAPRGRAFTQALLSRGGHLLLATLDACALVLVWRVGTGESVLSLEANEQPHALLRTAADVVCVARDGCLTAWDSRMIDAAGAAPKSARRGVKEVVVERTGERFYVTDSSEAVWRWSVEACFPQANFLHDGPVGKLRLSPDDVHLVTLSAEEIYIWRTETGQNIRRIGGCRATDVLIAPNNNFGVSISQEGLSRVWKLTHGSVVCSIHVCLSNAKVTPESTFLIGLSRGRLLAASLWSGSVSKRFSCGESSERVVGFHTLSEHPDFAVVMTASGAVYTWKVAEETVCRQFQLPHSFRCRPRHFQMSSDGRYALLSADNDTISLLDLSRLRLCSHRAEGPVVEARMENSGRFVAYISLEEEEETRVWPVLTVVRLADGENVGSVRLPKNPLTLVVGEQQCVYVGFEDGSVGVYSVSEVASDREESLRCRENVSGQLKTCPFDREPTSWLPLATPNIIWP